MKNIDINYYKPIKVNNEYFLKITLDKIEN